MSNKRLSATITIGGAITGSLRTAFGTASKSLTQLGAETRRLSGEQRMLGSSIQTFGRMGKNVDGLREKYASVTKELERMRKAHEGLARLENAKAANMAQRGKLRGQMMDTIALGAMAGAPIAAAISFETAMLGVAKQLDGARDASGNLTDTYHGMAAQIKGLSRELPIATNEIAGMVAAGLRMGIAKDEVIEFTRRTAEMATAFDAPAEELADQMGKIASLYRIPLSAIGALGDSINYLDDNTQSTGAGIIEYLTRVGGVASAVKVTGGEMAALGSTLLTLGERTETAGTATNAMFQKLAAADKGTKKFKMAMEEIGLTTEEVQKGMQSDAMGTMLKVLDAIGQLDDDKRLGVMVELVGLEHSDTMAKLSTNTAELRNQLALANSEAAKGSMAKEFGARMATTAAQMELLRNSTQTLAVNLGSVLLPAITRMTGALEPMVSKVAQLAETYPMATKVITGTVTAMVGLKVAALGSAYAFTFVKGGILAAATVFTRARTVVTGLVSVLPLVAKGILAIGRAAMANPIGLAVTAIAGGAYLIYKYWEPISTFFTNLWDGVKTTVAGAWETFKEKLSWHPLAMVANNWDPIKSYFTGLFDDIKVTVGSAIEWITSKIAWVGDTWKATKSFFGMGDDEPAASQPLVKGAVVPPEGESFWGRTKTFLGFGDESKPAAEAPLPVASRDLPDVAMAAPSTTYEDNRVDHSQITLNVTQQPGESDDSLVKRIMAELDQRRGARERASLNDGAFAQ